ncbi:MAG: RnfABCDGE type electron transport complex subunit D [Oscillospiraceae bacterium]|nr:RnfABCDGE type electron transport complex subunit D [Oscillospiraceae bacterium]
METRRRLRGQKSRERQKERMILTGAALLSLLGIASGLYGLRVWLLGGIAGATALSAELICLRIRKRKPDFRAAQSVLDGWILLMLMPVTVPVPLLIISCVFAIIIGNFRIKGDTAPVIPAAPAGFCLAWLIRRAGVMQFPAAKGAVPLLSVNRSLLSAGASAGWNTHFRFPPNPVDWIIGVPGLPLGSCSLFLLLVIAAVFLVRNNSSGYVIVPMLLPLVCAFCFFTFFRFPVKASAAVLMCNQLLFSAVFIYGKTGFAPPKTAGVLFGLMTASAILWTLRYNSEAVMWVGVVLGPAAAGLRFLIRWESRSRHKNGTDNKKTLPV